MHGTIDQIHKNTKPIFLSVGSADIHKRKPELGNIKMRNQLKFAQKLKEFGIDHISVVEPDMPHKIISRTDSVKKMYDFLDKYLMPEKKSKSN